jgi:serine protease Do
MTMLAAQRSHVVCARSNLNLLAGFLAASAMAAAHAQIDPAKRAVAAQTQQQEPAPLQPALPISPTAETVYAQAKPRLLQIRTLLASAGRQSSLGSGFLVTPDGLAMTNYHVVSQYAMEPATYRMEFAAPDGTKGDLKLLAVDVANDLAVVQLAKVPNTGQAVLPFFQFHNRALDGSLPKGERLYSMGNPLDLGFTIVEGTYNSLVEKSYQERVHFSGAINAGMSGGPTVSLDGRIVGINVSKQIGGELVSFLVPGKFGFALLERARKVQQAQQGNAEAAMTEPAKTREEIGRQLQTWQSDLYKTLNDQGFRSVPFGPYLAPEAVAPWFTCWANTNVEQVPKPRALLNTTQCSTKTWLFVTNSFNIGSIDISHTYGKSTDLNAFQFASFMSQQWNLPQQGFGGRKHITQSQCVEEFVNAGSSDSKRPPLRVVWCAKALREYAELYNVSVMAITQDRTHEALISRLAMSAVSYDNAMAVAKRFIAAIEISAKPPVQAGNKVATAANGEVRK